MLRIATEEECGLYCRHSPDERQAFPPEAIENDIADEMLVWWDKSNNRTFACADGSVLDGVVIFDGIKTAKELVSQFLEDNKEFYELFG